MRISLFILILGLVCACKAPRQSTEEVYKVNLEQTGTMPEIGEVKYIPLETTDESLVGSIDKIMYHGGLFYFL